MPHRTGAAHAHLPSSMPNAHWHHAAHCEKDRGRRGRAQHTVQTAELPLPSRMSHAHGMQHACLPTRHTDTHWQLARQHVNVVWLLPAPELACAPCLQDFYLRIFVCLPAREWAIVCAKPRNPTRTSWPPWAATICLNNFTHFLVIRILVSRGAGVWIP